MNWVVALLLTFTAQIVNAQWWPQDVKQLDHQAISYAYYEDIRNELKLEKIRSLDKSFWQDQNASGLNKGFGNHAHWIRFSLHNPSSSKITKHLVINYSHLDYIDFYEFTNGILTLENHTGDRTPYNTRLVDHPEFVYPIELERYQTKTYIVRVESDSSLQVPIHLWNETPFYEHELFEQKLQFSYYGALAVMIALNLFIFILLREKTYLYYSMATAGFLMFFLSLRGFTFEIFWPNAPAMHHQILATSLPFIATFSLLFCRSFLNTKERNPAFDKIIMGLISIEMLVLFTSFFISYGASLKISASLGIVIWLVLSTVGPIEWYRGNRSASFFTLAWSLLTLGFVLTALNKVGVFPTNFITEYGMQLGSAIEATILTLALADRLYHERENKLLTNLKLERESQVRREAEFQLIHQSLHHPITKLPNRNHLEMVINESINIRPEQRLNICIIKLSQFGDVTRTLGYQHSDELLSVIADCLNETVRTLPGIIPIEEDGVDKVYLSSFEGASFGILVEETTLARNKKQLEKVMKRVYEPILFNGLQLELGPLFGVSSYPKDGTNAAMLLRHANVALEQANYSHNRLSRYNAENDRHNAQQLTLMAELKTAIAEDQLELYYQPKLHSKTNKLAGLEALLRWNHSQFGFVAPDSFIPMAEKTGLIHDVTRWVLNRAMLNLKQLHDMEHYISISVNLSPLNLIEKTLPDFLEGLVKKHQINREFLVIELTETSTMDDPQQCLDALNKLQSMGFQISIDDFGSGYSSLTYIKNVPAKEIKIDKSLISDLVNQDGDQIIVKTTIDMCHRLGYEVTAEGVENQETQALLKELNCDYLQGYFFARPIPYDSMKMWLESYELQHRKTA